MKNTLLFLTLLSALSTPLYASETSDEIALLRQQVQLLTERLNKLEKNSAMQAKQQKVMVDNSTKNSDVVVQSTSTSWTDRVTYKADFRDRYEYIDQQDREIRQRNRVRLRASFDMKVNENLSFGFGLASGGDDPTSSNQSLDGAFSTKGLQLDLAYFNWKMNEIFTLAGGKIKNPFYKPAKNPILWDGDVNPEGFALNFDNGFLEGSLVGFAVEERSSADDTLMFGGQVMHSFKTSESSKLITGVGYYDYQEIKGNTPLYEGNPKGNSLDANGNIANDFNTAEVFMEYKTKLANKPLSVYGNFYQNTAADDLDSAYTLGFKYGKVSESGSWDLGYAYLDVEADAVVGLFNDSDFAGGNTDSKGHLLKAGYGLNKNVALGLTYIDSEIGQSQLTQTDYDRLQLDFIIKFK